ncbi:hypothetical protein SprV_0902743500 [Sparganum proliferum]
MVIVDNDGRIIVISENVKKWLTDNSGFQIHQECPRADLAIETIELLLQSKYDETDNRLGHAQILQLLKFCLRTYFTFNGAIYEQVKGTPMGSPISGFKAEAVLQRLESLVFQHHRPNFCARCIPDQEKTPLGIDDCQLEEVDSFKYPGAGLLPNGQSKEDIASRIDDARWVFSSLRKCLWNRHDLSIATKIRVHRASVRSVLLYGCECWALRVEDERKLGVFDHPCLRSILRVKFTDFVSNETVRARCDNIARITQAIQERRLKWFGHVLRRPPQELNVAALDPAPLPHWRRRRGGQFKTWLDTVRQDMEVVLGPSVFGLRRWRREWVELSRSAAADRHTWRGTVRDIIEAG